MAEKWDLLDSSGNVVGQIERKKRWSADHEYHTGVIPEGLYHTAVEVIPFDETGTMLLIQRDWGSYYAPGMWEFPAGSAISGEAPEDAGKRELKEETGLETEHLVKLHESRAPGVIRHHFAAYVPNLRDRAITLQPGESADFRFVSYGQWLRCCSEGLCDNDRILGWRNDPFIRNLKLVLGEPCQEWENGRFQEKALNTTECKAKRSHWSKADVSVRASHITQDDQLTQPDINEFEPEDIGDEYDNDII